MQIIQLRVEKKSQHANTPTDHHSVNEKNISRDPNQKKKNQKEPNSTYRHRPSSSRLWYVKKNKRNSGVNQRATSEYSRRRSRKKRVSLKQ